jgi:hypothetical protein
VNRFYFDGLYCQDCKKLKSAILTGTVPEDQIDPNFVLVVTYDINEETHDGYCSDPYDSDVETRTETCKYPLLIMFTNEDIDDEGNITNLYSQKMKYFHLSPTNHGNGFCGKKTTYSITKAFVKEIVRKIDLGR